jgi:hypothetical protein
MHRTVVAIFFLQLFLTIFATGSSTLSEYVYGSIIGMNILIWGRKGFVYTVASLIILLYQIIMCLRYGTKEPGQFLLFLAGLSYSCGLIDFDKY